MESNYESHTYEYSTGKSDWKCESCYRSMLKNKIPMQTQLNNMELCPEFSEYDRLCPMKLMLISQIIPFMFVIAKTKSAHHGLKLHCGLVPADLKNIQAY